MLDKLTCIGNLFWPGIESLTSEIHMYCRWTWYNSDSSCHLYSMVSYLKNPNACTLSVSNIYRVTIQVVSSLPLTPKQRLCFSTWASYINRAFVSMSTGGLTQPEWSPCSDKQDLVHFQISNANVSCSYECLTGERGCYSNETSSSAVIGGLTPIDNPVDAIEVIEESGENHDDLVPELPHESSRR